MDLNFERQAPPVLTRRMLEAERARRAALRQRNLALALTALLAVVSNLAFWLLLRPWLGTPEGRLAAVWLAASELAALLCLIVFAVIRRERQWQSQPVF